MTGAGGQAAAVGGATCHETTHSANELCTLTIEGQSPVVFFKTRTFADFFWLSALNMRVYVKDV